MRHTRGKISKNKIVIFSFFFFNGLIYFLTLFLECLTLIYLVYPSHNLYALRTPVTIIYVTIALVENFCYGNFYHTPNFP